MRILIADDSIGGGNAHFFIRSGYAKAFQACGLDTFIWDIYARPAIDVFNEINPDIFIGQTYNLERGVIKSILDRPSLKVALTGSDWSEYSDKIDINKYPILRANDKEIKLVEKLNQQHPIDFIYCHYHNNDILKTHHYWKDKLGINILGIPLAADIDDYINGQFLEELSSDICFIGGYWPYKSQILDRWLLPLCDDELNLNVKIFGNRPWPTVSYCGFLQGNLSKHAFKSAKVCPSLSEPHAHTIGGHDLVERPFKLLSNKCPVVMDETESFAKNFFKYGEVLFAKTPQEFKEKCLAVIHGDLSVDTQYGYDLVMGEHTYFHRCEQMFRGFGLKYYAEYVLDCYSDLRNKFSI